MKKRIIIAYACSDDGSEPSVGYHWSETIAEIKIDEEIFVFTRANNDISTLINSYNIKKVNIDLPQSVLWIKKIIGVRAYYLLWTFLVLFHLLINKKKYKTAIVHHITFTPVYYPPIYFILPYVFIWGPIGGGETYPLAYLKSMKFQHAISEIIRYIQTKSIYINPLFYLGCMRSKTIICSTKETAALIPQRYQNKIAIELMVFDFDKTNIETERDKTIIIANRFIHWKMTHLFIDAFNEYLKKYQTEYKLIIIGNGPYKTSVLKYVNNQNIIYHQRFENRNEMFKLLRKSSLFVSMSLRDSGAASLLEAISYNVPFLVPNSGAHKQFLEKNIGFGFELLDYEIDKIKIINLLKKILNDSTIISQEINSINSVYKNYFSKKPKTLRIKKILND